MSAIVVPLRGLSVVSLGDADGAGPPPGLFDLIGGPSVRHVVVKARTAAQRTLTASQIDRLVLEADRAVLMVAQGVGCAAAAWWARLSPRSYVDRVAGALFVAPEATGQAGTCFASPRSALPFPSLVVGATDAAQRLSSEWGGRLIDGPVPVPERHATRRLQSLVLRFTGAIVDRDRHQALRLLDGIGDG